MCDKLLSTDSFWMNRSHYENAEQDYHTHLVKVGKEGHSEFQPRASKRLPHSHQGANKHGPGHFHPGCHHGNPQSGIAGQIAQAREHIRHSLFHLDGNHVPAHDNNLAKRVSELESTVEKLTSRLSQLEKFCHDSCKPCGGNSQKASSSSCCSKATPCATPAAKKEETKDADDDFELFGSDGEGNDEAEKLKQERLKAYEEKKAKKPQLVAKSNIIFDVKPWNDETDMKKLEECVRSVKMDGLLWGASKLVPLVYGIKKLQITSVVEDDKVGTEELEEALLAFDEYIQSVDIAAFNKI